MNGNESTTIREPLPIKNRDIVLLSNVLYTMQDVSATERKRQWMQDRLWNITAKLTGMPGGHGEIGGLEKQFADISEMESRYELECAEFMSILKQAEDILNSIPSRSMRTIVTMKYVLDIPNNEIMRRLNIGRVNFKKLCRIIEEAEDMASVKWVERYILRS